MTNQYSYASLIFIPKMKVVIEMPTEIHEGVVMLKDQGYCIEEIDMDVEKGQIVINYIKK